MKTDFRIVTDSSDVPSLVELSREAHAESRFSYVDFSERKVEKIALEAIDAPLKQAIFLASRNGVAVGMSYCSVGEYHIGIGTLLATIHNLNVSKKVRSSLRGGEVALGLMRGVKTWSQSRGAKEVLFHVTSDVQLANTHKLAKRLGFKFVGGSYALSL